MARGKIIHEFWFGKLDPEGRVDPARSARWFRADPEFDREIRAHFESDLRAAAAGRRVRWEERPTDALALVLLFDQFPRNMYRGTPRAFMFDQRASQVMRRAFARGHEAKLWPIECAFLYLPLQHAEDETAQDESVERFSRLVEAAPMSQKAVFRDFLRHAEKHQEVIRTFGRFPHRNGILERESTPAEIAYLEKGGIGSRQRATQ